MRTTINDILLQNTATYYNLLPFTTGHTKAMKETSELYFRYESKTLIRRKIKLKVKHKLTALRLIIRNKKLEYTRICFNYLQSTTIS